jgi:hypothetical protein
LALRIVILPQPSASRFQDCLRCLRRLLGEHLGDHDGVLVGAVQDPPCHGSINNPQLVAPSPHLGHGSRVRKRQHRTLLKLAKQDPGLDTGCLPEGRRLHLSMKPHERLVLGAHFARLYVEYDMGQGSSVESSRLVDPVESISTTCIRSHDRPGIPDRTQQPPRPQAKKLLQGAIRIHGEKLQRRMDSEGPTPNVGAEEVQSFFAPGSLTAP